MNDDDITKRLESPINLMNRLRALSSNPVRHPSLPPSIDDLVKDVDKKLEDQSDNLKSQAQKVLAASLRELEARMPDVQKPEKLASIARDMSAVIDNQNKKSASEGKETTQVIIYAPQIRDERTYATINSKE